MISLKKKFYLFVLLLLPVAELLAQRNYYISPAGNDNDAGTQLKPFMSIEKLNQLVFQPGDRILFKAGGVYAGSLVLDETDSSNASHPIIIGSYGEGRATLKASSGNGILVRNLGGIHIQDLVLTSDGLAGNEGHGVKVLNDRPGNHRLKNIRIHNVEASGFKWAGIYVGGVPTDLPNVKYITRSRFGFEDIVITNCVAHGNMYHGIHVSASWKADSKDYGNKNVIVRDCIAYKNQGDSTYTANHSGSGILIDDVERVLIEYCVAYENGEVNAGLTGGPCGIWTHASNNAVIQHCEAYNNRTNGAADGGGFDMDGGVTNSVIQYCYSHDNEGAGYLIWNYDNAPHELSNNIIRYCISANDARKHGYGAIHIGTSGLPITNIKVYNNTILIGESSDAKVKGIWTGGSKPNESIHFYNNVIVTDGNVPLAEIEAGEKDSRFIGNAYWCAGKPFSMTFDGAAYTALASWRSAKDAESDKDIEYGIFTDPKMRVIPQEVIGNPHRLSRLKSFRLTKGSPLKGQGILIPDNGGRDFWGKRLPEGRPTIGAFQL